jgi:hypothetical protein
MAKKIDETRVCSCCKGPFYVVDEGKDGGFHGVWRKNDDGLWSHLCSGLNKENAEAVAGALNVRGVFGKLNKFAKSVILK